MRDPGRFSHWTDVTTMAAFAYSGAHREALSKSSEWFQRGPWPASAAWWAPIGQQPTWIEVAERLDHLHAHGSTPYAFDFRHPFDAEGRGTEIGRSLRPARTAG